MTSSTGFFSSLCLLTSGHCPSFHVQPTLRGSTAVTIRFLFLSLVSRFEDDGCKSACVFIPAVVFTMKLSVFNLSLILSTLELCAVRAAPPPTICRLASDATMMHSTYLPAFLCPNALDRNRINILQLIRARAGKSLRFFLKKI